jgi:CheY-like chemotaxis protein
MQWNVLLVDDETGIIQALRRMLRNEPYVLYEANNASEALHIIRQHDIHLMVTDYKMPITDGLTLCREVRRLSPTTYRILLSGQVDYPALQQAWRNGDVHRFVAKPWDNLLLTSDIQEGLKQHQLLRKAHFLRHSVQGEQPLLLTDDNWIIRLANQPLCAALGVNESDLVGVNLFAAQLSAMPVELEAEVTTQVEANHSWLGYFSFTPEHGQKSSAWMTISSVSDHYRVCLCRFVGDEITAPTDFKEELKRYAGAHPDLLTDKPSTHAAREQAPELIHVEFDTATVHDAALSGLCYERLQTACNEQYEIYTPELHHFLILVPAAAEPVLQLADHLTAEFEDAISYQGERRILTPQVRIEHINTETHQWQEALRERLGLTPKKPAQHSAPSRAQAKATLLFSQRGRVIGLLAPEQEQSEQQWCDWLTAMHSAWSADFSGALPVCYRANELPEASNRQYLSALKQCTDRFEINATVILSEGQILGETSEELEMRSEWHQAQCKLFMANFGRSFLNSRQVLALPIQGVVLAPEFLSNMRSSKSLPQSRRLLQRIHDHQLTIYAPEINTTEDLAAAHQSNVDWLSGDVLAQPLAADQLMWFAH